MFQGNHYRSIWTSFAVNTLKLILVFALFMGIFFLLVMHNIM